MEVEQEETGGEYNFCINCSEDGDNTNLYKIKGKESFVCWSCFEEYKEALNTIRFYDSD